MKKADPVLDEDERVPQKYPNGYFHHLILPLLLPWSILGIVHVLAGGFLPSRLAQRIGNTRDFGTACIGKLFPYRRAGLSNLLRFLPVFARFVDGRDAVWLVTGVGRNTWLPIACKIGLRDPPPPPLLR